MKTSKNYTRLVELQKQYPELTFDNKGYENLSVEIANRNKKAIKEISSILSEEVNDFVSFQNFKPRNDGAFDIRCQTIYDHESYFIGVCYIPINDFK